MSSNSPPMSHRSISSIKSQVKKNSLSMIEESSMCESSVSSTCSTSQHNQTKPATRKTLQKSTSEPRSSSTVNVEHVTSEFDQLLLFSSSKHKTKQREDCKTNNNHKNQKNDADHHHNHNHHIFIDKYHSNHDQIEIPSKNHFSQDTHNNPQNAHDTHQPTSAETQHFHDDQNLESSSKKSKTKAPHISTLRGNNSISKSKPELPISGRKKQSNNHDQTSNPGVEEVMKQVKHLENIIRHEFASFDGRRYAALLDLVSRLKATLNAPTLDFSSRYPQSPQSNDNPILEIPTRVTHTTGEPYWRLGREYVDVGVETNHIIKTVKASNHSNPSTASKATLHGGSSYNNGGSSYNNGGSSYNNGNVNNSKSNNIKSHGNNAINNNNHSNHSESNIVLAPAPSRAPPKYVTRRESQPFTSSHSSLPVEPKLNENSKTVIRPEIINRTRGFLSRTPLAITSKKAASLLGIPHKPDSNDSNGDNERVLRTKNLPKQSLIDHIHMDLIKSLDDSEEELRFHTSHQVASSPTHLAKERCAGPIPREMLTGEDDGTKSSSEDPQSRESAIADLHPCRSNPSKWRPSAYSRGSSSDLEESNISESESRSAESSPLTTSKPGQLRKAQSHTEVLYPTFQKPNPSRGMEFGTMNSSTLTLSSKSAFVPKSTLPPRTKT